ncbi:MAG TPA: hypothetical protein VGD60_06705, partial [Candidatus Acidoferrales bacterium]
ATFQSIFKSLKKILQAHEEKLFIKKNDPGHYYAETQSHSWQGHRMFFAAAIIKKNYVSFHLMPLYVAPELLKTIPPNLKRRMQGKACFNFTTPDPQLFQDLAKLTKAGLQKYMTKKFL